MFLAYVVSGVLLLSAFALSFLSASTTSYRLARNSIETARIEAAEEAALVRAVLGLIDLRRERRWRVDGAAQAFKFGDFNVRVAIQDELGRIDINHADRSSLSGLFQAVGLHVDAAGGLADKVLDWRSSRLGGGAEPYRTERLAYAPRNGPFQSVDELKLVPGMTPGLYRRVERALTVYSGRQFLDPQFAPAEALAALQGHSREAAAALMAARSSQGARAGIIDLSVALGGRAFAVRLEVERAGATRTREMVVRLTDDPAQPYWLLSSRGR